MEAVHNAAIAHCTVAASSRSACLPFWCGRADGSSFGPKTRGHDRARRHSAGIKSFHTHPSCALNDVTFCIRTDVGNPS